MTLFELPAGQAHDVDLVAEPRLNAGGGPARIHSRISFGTPSVHPLTAQEAAKGNAEWGDFVVAEARHSDYCLLGLVCTLRPGGDGDVFEDAAVGIELESPGQPANRQPIAWSIAPKERTYPAAANPAQIQIGASLGVQFQVTIPWPPTPDAVPYVVGMGEKDSDPEWRLHATSGRALIGDEPISLTVKIPAGQPAVAHLRFAATIRQKRFGLIPYYADLPPLLSTIDLRG